MSKRLKRLLFAGIAVVALVGLLLALLLLLPEKEEPVVDDDKRIKLIDLDDEKLAIKTVELVTPAETFRVVRNEEDALYVEQYADLPINTSKIASLEDYLFSLSANKKVLDSTDKPADFGLDQPAVKVTATYSDGTAVSFSVGNKEPGNDGYYLQMEGDPAVYLLGTYGAGIFLTESKNYVSTTMASSPFANEDDKNAYLFINEATLSGSCRKEPVVIRSVNEKLTDEFPYCNYYVEKPHRAGVTTDSGVEDSVSALTSLSALAVDTVHPTADRIKECGLDNPYSQATVTSCIRTYTTDSAGNKTYSSYDTREYTVKLGGKTEEGYYYGMVDGIDVIYHVTADAVPWATYTFNDIATNMLFIRNIATVSELAFTANGETHTFAITHSENETTGNDEIAVKADGKQMEDTDSFRKVYQVLMNVPRVGDADKPTDAAAVTVTLKDLDGKTVVESAFYKRTASTYVCRRSDDDYYAVAASQVENIVTQVNNYLAGKPVSVG